jgi:hypothetical protein
MGATAASASAYTVPVDHHSSILGSYTFTEGLLLPVSSKPPITHILTFRAAPAISELAEGIARTSRHSAEIGDDLEDISCFVPKIYIT